MIVILRHYFDFLQLPSNPTRGIKVRGIQRMVAKDLLSTDRLYSIYENIEVSEQSPQQQRNKVIIGLIVFQGLDNSDLEALEIDDIQLKTGTVRIKGRTKKNERRIALQSIQMIDLYEYLQTIRPQLLKQKEQPTQQLLLPSNKGNSLSNVLIRIANEIRRQNEDISDLKQLRQSVIANWIKQHNVREAQYLAGHRYISSTEKYQQHNLDELKEEVERFFPV